MGTRALAGTSNSNIARGPAVAVPSSRNLISSGPILMCSLVPIILSLREFSHVVVVRYSHAADAGIGSMHAVRAGPRVRAGTGRHERRGAAVYHPHQRTEPPDTHQPRTPRQAARFHILPLAVPEHPQGRSAEHTSEL